MLNNRSVPHASVIPVLLYDDIVAASDWLCETFGFRERLRIAEHRSQLVFGDGAVIVGERRRGVTRAEGEESHPDPLDANHAMIVRIEDVDSHLRHVRACGAKIIQEPVDHMYGERQYTVEDPGGHRWTFSQTLADVHPKDWGGTLRDEV